MIYNKLLKYLSSSNVIYIFLCVFSSILIGYCYISISDSYYKTTLCSIDDNLQPYYFKPYISIFIFDLIKNYFGCIGIIISGQILFPIISMFLTIKFINRNIAIKWSIALTLLAFSFYPDYPFRQFLLDIVNFDFGILGSTLLPEALKFPTPSFTNFAFIALLYFSTFSNNLTIFKYILFTFLFSCLIFISAVDAIYGISFWIIYSSLKLYRKYKSFFIFVRYFLLQILLVLAITAFAVYINKHTLVSKDYSNYLSLYFLTVYFFIPLLLTLIVYLVQRVDPYYILFRFSPVYILMFIEFFMINFGFFLPINLDIAERRSLQFFIHVYYYVPVIYLLSLDLKFKPTIGLESNKFSIYLRNILFTMFNKFSKFYLLIIISLLFLYNLISLFKFNT